MKRIITFFSIVFLAISLVGCGSKEVDDKISLPISSDLEDTNYQDVVSKLKDAGFTNVQTEVIDDLVFGWMIKDGQVEEVSVDGYTTFSADSKYPADVEIVVSYHTFPADEEDVAAGSSTPETIEETEPAEEEQSSIQEEIPYDLAYRVGFDGYAAYYLIDTTSSKITHFYPKIGLGSTTATYTGNLSDGIDFELDGRKGHAETKYDGAILTVTGQYGTAFKSYKSDVNQIKGYQKTPEEFNNEIITVDNNEEFVAILNTTDQGDQIIEEFAVKYAGRTIEFDGNIAYMNNHGDYTTRYDFLISPWDYSETSGSGPNFQFEDCGVFELHLIGDNIPDTIGMGDNLHFVAKLEDYNETSQLFHLNPISTEFR